MAIPPMDAQSRGPNVSAVNGETSAVAASGILRVGLLDMAFMVQAQPYVTLPHHKER
jgi:hypothetical protein